MAELEPFSFRRLTDADLDLMCAWLDQDWLLETWGPRCSPEEWTAQYRAYIRGEKPTEPYLILYGQQPIGYIQTYRLSDYPEYWTQLGLDQDGAGLDLFIGEPDFLNRGLGPAVIRRFIANVVFARYATDQCVIGPAVSNRRAIRAYEKAGFRYLRTVELDDEDEPEYLMAIRRADIRP